MPEAQNQSAVISVGGDFTPFERQALDAFKRTQGIFSKNFLGGSAFSRPLGEISARADEFTKSMTAANARVVAFGASAGVIYTVSKALREMVSSTIAVNKALTEVNVFLKLSNDGLQGFSGQLFDIAKGTGKSFQDIAKGATELARQGLGAEETLTRIKDAAILARQSGDDMTSTVEALTAAINSFAKTGLTTTQLINKLANVDAEFSVSSKDLAEGIKRVGSTADTAGVSIDQLIGLITSVQQTTQRGGPVIGNALKSILTRVERPQILTQLREVGIQIDNISEGSNKSIFVLTQLAKTFDTLTESQQSQVAELVGSVYQINVLKALLGDLNKNYSVYGAAVRTSTTAQDEAIKRNDEYNKSLDAILNKTKVTLTAVGSQVGDLTVAPALKKITGALDLLFGDVSKEGTSIGGEIGKGVLKGIGNFISGPGIVLLGATIGKLAKDFSGFFLKASKDFFGLNEASKQQGDLRTKLQAILAHEPQLLDAILTKNLSQVEAEKTLVALLQERLAIEERLSQVSSKVASNALAKGTILYDAENNLKGGAKAASGLIPNITPERTEFSELLGALKGGYKPGSIRRMNVKGIGGIVYNTAEKIKDFGFDQPAILPPEQSKAGRSYRLNFKKVHGFDPYISPENHAAGGLVPNKIPNFKGSLPTDLMVEQLGPKRAIKKSDAEALHVQKIREAVDESKVLRLSSPSDISKIYASYPDAQEKISELGDALKNADKAQQRKIIQDAAKDVKQGLLRQGLQGIEIPVKIGNATRKLFIDSKKTAAGGLIPFKKIGQGNFADVYDVGHGLVAKKYSPAKQIVQRLGEQMAFQTFTNGITGLKYLSELATQFPKSGIQVAPPIHRSEIDPSLLDSVSKALGKNVFFQKMVYGDEASPEQAKALEKKANRLIKKNPYNITSLRDITSRNVKGGTVIDLATNYSKGLNPTDNFRVFDSAGYVRPSETAGNGIAMFLGMRYPELLDEYEGKTLQEVLDFISKKKPQAIEDAIKAKLLKRVSMGLIPRNKYAGGLTPVSKVFGLQKANWEFERDKLPYAVSPTGFVEDLLKSESVRKTQNYFGNKFGLSKPELFLENNLDEAFNRPGAGYQGLYSGSYTSAPDSPGRIHLGLSKLISDVSDGAGGKITNEDYLKVLRAGSASRGEHVFLHELYHNLSDKRGITNRIPESIFGRTKDVLGGKHLNEALAISTRAEDFSYQFQNAKVNGNREESAAETLANLILYPERTVRGLKGKVQIGDLPLSRYFKEQGIVPSFGNLKDVLSLGGNVSLRKQPVEERLANGFKVYHFIKNDERVGSLTLASDPETNKWHIQDISVPLARGEGLGGKAIQALVNEFGEIYSWDHRTSDADKMWKRIGGKEAELNGQKFWKLSSQDTKRANSGLVPNFAKNALKEAIAREQEMGSPSSAIKVGIDNRLKSFKNPFGLAVYNVKDEPAGLSQGINRALKEGKDPRTYNVPNFASSDKPFESTKLPVAVTNDLVRKEIEDFKAALQNGTRSFNDIASQVETLKTVFALTGDSANRAKQILEASYNTRPGNLQNSTQAGLQRASQNFPSSNEFTVPFQFPRHVPQSESFNIGPGVPGAEPYRHYLAGSETVLRAFDSPLPRAGTAIEPGQNDDLKAYQDRLRQTELGRKIISNAKLVQARKEKEALAAEQQADAAALQDKLKGFDDLQRNARLREKLAQNAKVVSERIQREQAETQIQVQKEIEAYQSLGKFVPFSQTRKDAQSFEARQKGSLGEQVRRGSITQDQADFTFQQIKKDANQNIAQKYSSAALAVSFTAPVLAGIVSQLAGDKTPTQRGIGASVEGVGNIASFASLGLSFGPHGALAGAGVGLLTSLPSIIGAFTDKLPDLQRELEKLSESTNRTSDALNIYITASEKLGDIYGGLVTATNGTVERLRSQQSESFSKLNPDQQLRISRALQNRGIQGLTEEKSLIDQEGKQAEVRKLAEVKLEEVKKGLGFFGLNNKFLEEDRSKVVGQQRITTGGGAAEAPVGTAFVPIFGTKLSKEGNERAEEIKSLILSLRGDRDKTISEILAQSPSDKFNTVQQDVQKGDVTSFISFLTETLQKTGLSEEKAGVVGKGFQRIGDNDTQKLIAQKVLDAISPQKLKENVDFNELFRSSIQRLQKASDDFANRLADAGLSLSAFNKSLEGVSKLSLQASTAREEERRTRGTNFTDLQENFAGPRTIAALRNQVAIEGIQGERRLGTQSAGSDFQNQVSQILSDSIQRFTSSELDRSQSVQTIHDRTDILEGSLRTLKNLGVNNINEVIKQGNPQDTQQNVGSILGRVTQSRTNLLRTGEITETLTQSERAQLNLLNDLEKPLRESLLEFSTNIEAANQKEREALKLQDIVNKATLDQIAVQKKLSIGGGIQGILATGNPFQNQLSENAFSIRAGTRNQDSLLSAQGALGIGSVIQSLGADVPDEIRDIIKTGLVDKLKETFSTAGVSLKKGSFEDVANTQVENLFKRDDKQAALLSELAKVLGGQGDVLSNIGGLLNKLDSENISIKQLVELAGGDNGGVFVQFKNSLEPKAAIPNGNLLKTAFEQQTPKSINDSFLQNTGSPFGIAKFTSDALLVAHGERPEIPRSDFDKITQRNAFGLQSNPEKRFLSTTELSKGDILGKLDIKQIDPDEIRKSFAERTLDQSRNISGESVFPKSVLKEINVALAPLQAQRRENDFETSAGNVDVTGGVNQKIRGLNRQKAISILFGNDKKGTPKDIFDELRNTLKSRQEQSGFGAESVRLNAIQAANRAAEISSNENDLKAFGNKLELQRIDIEKRLVQGKIDSLQAERELNAETESGIATLKQKLFEEGKISGDELRDQKSKAYSTRIDAKTNKLTDPLEAFRDQFRYNRNDYFKEITAGAQDVGKAMKTSFSDAFKSFIDGSRDAKGALKDFGIGALSKIQDVISQLSTNLLFKGLGSVLDSVGGNAFNGIANAFSNKSGGGAIKRYAVGGLVVGGSGTKDDVPAYLSEGEYVIKKQSVQKYSKEFLDSLNAQGFDAQPSFGAGVQGKSNDPAANLQSSFSAGPNSASVVLKNAFAYNDATHPTGGAFNTDSQLSNLALSDEDNPKNQKKFQREQDLFEYLRDKALYDEENRLTLRNFKRAQRQRLIGAYINAGIQIAGGTLSSISKPSSSSVANTPSGKSSPNARIRAGFNGTVSTGGYMTRYGIQRFDGGGSPRGRDKIPVLLTGGEYVLNSETVRRNGVGVASRINHGSFQKPIAYAEGGSVGNVYDRSEGSFKDVISALGEVTTSLKNNNTPASAQTGSVINNISISINIEKDGNVKTETKSQDQGKDQTQGDQNAKTKQFAELVKSVVVKTIIEQKKPNGLLAS
jgi:TP901 family phage tail tape measure protein